MKVTPVVLCASRASVAVYYVHSSIHGTLDGNDIADHIIIVGSSGCSAITNKYLHSKTITLQAQPEITRDYKSLLTGSSQDLIILAKR
jgi:hypothetical protein